MITAGGFSSPIPDHSGFDAQLFVSAADRIAAVFFEKTRVMSELIDSSVLFSDGLCVCALCEMYGVDYLIESGTGFGGSTEMVARYFADDPRLKQIWTIDMAVNPVCAYLLERLRIRDRDPHVWSSHRRARRIARERLSPFRKVKLVRGDGSAKIPEILGTLDLRKDRVGILIDGPKEAPQMALAQKLLESSSSVCFAALDDIGPMFDASGRYARFCKSQHAVFATSDRWFFERYGWVNNGRLPARMRGYPGHTGYGVGILVNLAATPQPGRGRGC